MAKHIVARVSEIPEGSRLIVELQGRSVGIFNVGGQFHALLNRCPHHGAELCRGSLVGRVEGSAPGEMTWSDEGLMIQCPWHGWEYDLQTGRSYTQSRARPFPVGVAQGEALCGEDSSPVQAAPETVHATAGAGRSGPRLHPGPFTAETFPISIEEEYVVVHLPGGARRASA